MDAPRETTGLQLRSLVTADAGLELSLAETVIPPPGPEEVVIRIEAAPINPSDILLMLAGADPATMRRAGAADQVLLTMDIPPAAFDLARDRIGLSLGLGYEAAGVVISAGASEATQALLGKTVAVFGGGMLAQYCSVKAADCLLLPEDVTPAEGAAAHVNPLTALGIVETVRRQGHSALIHTAAASTLGQMLNRICQNDGIEIVNIVRSTAQEEMLRALGARYVCNSTAPGFEAELLEAAAATGARIAFDAIGGGRLAGQILEVMHAAASRSMTSYSRYGSWEHKQLYFYGNLDPRPTVIDRSFGMAWGIAGWGMPSFMQEIGPIEADRLKARVAAEIRTTFACSFSKEISLSEALLPENAAAYTSLATGKKFLVNPTRE
jgi:NADPH:quinone reductase-like Zn-dependent oxidoreductase